jgi:hypothetical protein
MNRPRSTELRPLFISVVMAAASGISVGAVRCLRRVGDSPVSVGLAQRGFVRLWKGLISGRAMSHNVSRVCDVLAANSNVI